jgi:signal transduction histidine kinase
MAAEGELLRIERLASLGGLVAGVAHELNTPIGNVVTVASTLSSQANALGESIATGHIRRSDLTLFATNMTEGMRIILRGLERASTLIGHFKQVAVDQTSEQRRPFALAELIPDVVGSIRPQFSQSRVELHTSIASTQVLQSYPGPLGQVLINLIDNARLHAFDPKQTGEIWVTANDTTSAEVEIIVSDNGKGIPPELREKIFEPFFTTRLGQGGSGLGLSIVFNIVTGILEGAIRVQSDLGAGTAVILRLPAITVSRASRQLGKAFDADYKQCA